MKLRIQSIFLLLISTVLIISCAKENDSKKDSSFDRSKMLEFWANDLIVPSFQAYSQSLDQLAQKTEQFTAEPSTSALNELRNSWLQAYKKWQYVSMYDIGKAEEIGLRNYTNIYPTSAEQIERNISKTTVNLDLPSNFSAQGFPALDYLLYGIGDGDQNIVAKYQDNKYRAYLNAVVKQLQSKANVVVEDWTGSFKNSFIANDGSSATASTDKMVNDFLYYFEKFFRAGKIGIPAGVYSGSTLSTLVEAPYSGVYSKELFFDAFAAVQNFFNGKSAENGSSGISLKQYLDHNREKNMTEDIAVSILKKWTVAGDQAAKLDNNFKRQVESNNTEMLKVFDALQASVVLLKVDMMQSLNIQVDYVDADGD